MIIRYHMHMEHTLVQFVTAIDLRISHKNEFYFLEKWRGAPTGYKLKDEKTVQEEQPKNKKRK